MKQKLLDILHNKIFHVCCHNQSIALGRPHTKASIFLFHFKRHKRRIESLCYKKYRKISKCFYALYISYSFYSKLTLKL